MDTTAILKWLIPILLGGLGGASITILYNTISSKNKAKEREQAHIMALMGEIERSKLLCDFNSKQQHVTLATFARFPHIAAIKIAFEERHEYPKLKPIINDIGYYALAMLQINGMIDQYILLGTNASYMNKENASLRDDLRNKIAFICDGRDRLEGTGPQGFLIIPSYLNYLTDTVKKHS